MQSTCTQRVAVQNDHSPQYVTLSNLMIVSCLLRNSYTYTCIHIPDEGRKCCAAATGGPGTVLGPEGVAERAAKSASANSKSLANSSAGCKESVPSGPNTAFKYSSLLLNACLVSIEENVNCRVLHGLCGPFVLCLFAELARPSMTHRRLC